MNRIFLLAFVLIGSLLMSDTVQAQKFPGMDKSPMDAAAFPADYRNADKLIKVVYSRPQLKGRDLSSLAPNGKVWRTGANEAAEVTLYVDMKWGDTAIPAGTYSFFTIPGENEWTAILSKDLNVWGSYFYKEANDVARITVPASTGDESVEAFSIVFDKAEGGVDMHLGWGTTRAVIPFRK